MVRRRVLQGLVAGACCMAPGRVLAGRSESLSADFSQPGASALTLDYWDADNFRLVPAVAGSETWVVSGRIYLVVRPSIATANAQRVLWVGQLVEANSPPSSAPSPLVRTALSPKDVDALKLGTAVHDVDVPADGRARPACVLSVAGVERLARAQYVVDRRMRAAMDMSLCGDGIDRLLGSWRPEVTGAGMAVVAEAGGYRLAAPLRDMSAELPKLPSGLAVEDYRVPPTR